MGSREESRSSLRARVAAASDPLAVLRQDQFTRWEGGDRVPAEEYLELFPELSDDDALVLIISEVGLRMDGGERPSSCDYRSRFPHLADELVLQFELLPISNPSTVDVAEDRRFRDSQSTLLGEFAPSGEQHRPIVPGYELTELIGQGGMGLV
jgi:hypothetical protein